ncbi:MAG: ABC transporter ATP-binding protein/permease, partial [Oscillospiraceae bacterium]|nr:ABC transporter ATP-binding protein/permease [Oscillospiraceae bacterium]MCL2279709.1 ABC transporter ATP-binding protein/permease [Oscillospiraceae bacterium]
MKKIKLIIEHFPEFLGTLKWCLSLSWQTSRFYTASRIFTEILTPVLAIVVAFIGRLVINLLAGQAEVEISTEYMLVILLGGLCLIAIVRGLSQNIMQYCRTMHDDMMNAKIAAIIMEHALKADIEYFDNPDYYDKLNSANRDSYAVNNVIWNTISIISSGISFVIAFAVLSQMSMIYGIALVAAAIPASIVAAGFTKALYILSLEQINGLRQMGYIQGISSERAFTQDFRLFNVGEILKSRYRRIWKGLFITRRRKSRKRTVFVSILEAVPEIVIALISIDIAFRVIGGYATVGDYSLFVGLTAQLWGAISLFSLSAMQVYDNRMQLDNFKSISEFKNKVEDKGEKALAEIETIELIDVSFSYPGTNNKALDGISLLLDKRRKTAVVGLNGSGKSTLIKLILRLYEPDSGDIKVNGIDIREYTLASLRSNFSVYFQDMQNFSFTLRENFTYSDNSGGDDYEVEQRARAALRAAGADDILEKCGQGIDTNITRYFSDDGIELSGGQHQKLALARALFRSCSALVLDEPSSNLDPKAEHEVFGALSDITDGKMTIFTSHRLSNT